jgi:hypothetical protein
MIRVINRLKKLTREQKVAIVFVVINAIAFVGGLIVRTPYSPIICFLGLAFGLGGLSYLYAIQDDPPWYSGY